jgi:hypothetical protein
MRSADTLQSVRTALSISAGQGFMGLTVPGVLSEHLPKVEEKVKQLKFSTDPFLE